MNKKILKIFILWLLPVLSGVAQVHPGLLLTRDGVKEIRKWSSRLPAFAASLAELKEVADEGVKNEIGIPLPKDEGGGYTHEKHKRNYLEMNAAGILYQISGNRDYAQFVRKMLMAYAGMYPGLELHPSARSATPGKIFWQTLNDAVWLVHAAGAYDCVYDFIPESDRLFIEKNLFHPAAEFISNGNPQNYAVFNKMHNHGTWANAAVGITGYVIGDRNLVEMALYGSKKDGSSGFFRQLDVLFSPDGYFTEGPYYHRYALWPFMTFAQVIQNRQPELHVFGYRDGILFRATEALTQLAYNGELFYLNDALPKTFQSADIVSSLDIAFKNNPSKKDWIEYIRLQNAFLVSDAGIFAAKEVVRKKPESVIPKSVLLTDGPAGDEGGIAILRSGSGQKQTCLTFKATSHGLTHGHYDKLSVTLYDNGNQVIPDYGSARFLNIESKSGGNYTPENYTWAMQSIAHNTVSVNEKCQFNGDIRQSSRYHSDIGYADFSNPGCQVVCGIERNAFPGVVLQRTLAMLRWPDFENPVVLDVFRVLSDSLCQADLPFYFRGQLVFTSFQPEKKPDCLMPLGKENGYQHLWPEATGKTNAENAVFTWITGDRFYNVTTLSDSGTRFYMVRAGANDPGFNLRPEQGMIIRKPDVRQHTFVSVIEPCGVYDLTREVTAGSRSRIARLRLTEDNNSFSLVTITLANNKSYRVILMNSDFNSGKQREVTIDGKAICFTGNYHLTEQ